MDPNQERIEDYQRRIQEQAQRLAAEQAQLEQTKEAMEQARAANEKEALQKLAQQQKELADQAKEMNLDKAAKEALAKRGDDLLHDPATQVLGNKNSDCAIVEFFDNQCPYCQANEPEIQKLLKDDTKVIVNSFLVKDVSKIKNWDPLEINAGEIATKQLKKPRAFNMVIMGAMVKMIPGLDEAKFLEALKAQFKVKYEKDPELEAVNAKAFEIGYELA